MSNHLCRHLAMSCYPQMISRDKAVIRTEKLADGVMTFCQSMYRKHETLPFSVTNFILKGSRGIMSYRRMVGLKQAALNGKPRDFLADPSKGDALQTVAWLIISLINSVILFLPRPYCTGYHVCTIGSKLTTMLMNGWILPICVVVFERVCTQPEKHFFL